MFQVMSEKLNPFGCAVLALRNRLNLSQGDVARRSKGGKRKGITSSYLSLIESGQVLPETLTVKTLTALARGLSLPAVLLFAMTIGAKSSNSDTIEQIIAYANKLSVARQKDILLIAKAFFRPGDLIEPEDELLYESDIEEFEDVPDSESKLDGD